VQHNDARRNSRNKKKSTLERLPLHRLKPNLLLLQDANKRTVVTVFVALRHPYIVLLLIKIHIGRTFNTPNDTGTTNIRLSKELRGPLKLQARGSLTHNLAYELFLLLNTGDCEM